VKFGAIDIGSNGARLLICSVLEENSTQVKFKDVEYTRFPLRLGTDVFSEQKIGKKKAEQLIKLMKAFKLLLELHEVEDYMTVATSAFREAKNGLAILKEVKLQTGVEIEIIDGSKEAEILDAVIVKELNALQNYIHIDVGGGSTELNLYFGTQKIAAKSFPMGSIRNVGSRQNIQILKNIRLWIEENLKKVPQKVQMYAIGTGGNINKIASLLKTKNQTISPTQLKDTLFQLNQTSFYHKVNNLQLNPDRADTICPAAYIYLSVMEWAGATKMQVPELGLTDGMMEIMWKKYQMKGLKQLKKKK
jgi:exopolyphosphatase/guanosine-5'-triphosphate,3'-diphosphate pyrophosphatase